MRIEKDEVADIFRLGFADYLTKNKLPTHKIKTAGAIIKCRTAALGGHKDECTECGHIRISYNSCRNRHCPKCQNLAKEKWLEARKEELLPVKYFHVVFTVPDLLNDIIMKNQQVMYKLLFDSASETMNVLFKSRLQANYGMIAILHTWGQNLSFHPHIHCVVPGGGISEKQEKWTATNNKYLFPIKMIEKVYKGKFLDAFKKLVKNESMQVDNTNFKKLINILYNKNWVVYAKKPFANSEQVFNYLGRYTHRVAISNERIIDIEDDAVSFFWKNYRLNGKKQVMQLKIAEFIRRFLFHILPSGFCKIRYYGFLSCRVRKKMIELLKEYFEEKLTKEGKTILDWKNIFRKVTGIDLDICPYCKQGRMIRSCLTVPS